MLPTRATVWQALVMRGNEAGRFREVEGISIIADLYNLNNTLANDRCFQCFAVEIIDDGGLRFIILYPLSCCDHLKCV